MNTDTDRHCNDLTQLCSREQLSALMDGALSEDQTRFLLRRLQHDTALAGCWERWRMTADVLRGMAPAQRLPAGFAARVAACVRDGAPVGAAARAVQAQATASRRRWGGGVALAAALATLAVVLLPTNESELPGHAQRAPLLAAATTTGVQSAPAAPLRQPAPRPLLPAGAEPEALAAALAVATRPSRRNGVRHAGQRAPEASVTVTPRTIQPELAITVAQPDGSARPWPRSILPQYGHGNFAARFGDPLPYALASEPFNGVPAFVAPPHAATVEADPQP